MVATRLRGKYGKGQDAGGGHRRSSYSWWRDDFYLRGLVGATVALVGGGEMVSYLSSSPDSDLENEKKTNPVKKWNLGSATYNANDPMEDRHVFTDLSGMGLEGLIAAVFDGHGGWQVSEFARKRITGSLGKSLQNIGPLPVDEDYDPCEHAIINTFLQLDRDFFYDIRNTFRLGFGRVANTGSCALLAFMRRGNLYVANAGDCRAVLARTSDDKPGTLESVALSRDHNAREELEQKILMAVHPFESDIVKCKTPNICYVKGKLQPTRSLGDAYLKYSEFNGHPDGMSGRYMPPPYTPPYITAEPEVARHVLDSRDQFLLMASDGLWDYVSNDEALEVASGVLRRGLGSNAACKALVERVLTKAAKHHNISVDGLRKLPAGPQRRKKHDDITVLCIEFVPQHQKSATQAPEP